MAPKQTKGGDEVLKQIEIYQAIVIADTFNSRFGPLTQDKPNCLLPVVNTPVIDFTLECLENAGLQEVYLYCKQYSDQIKDHIKKSRWNEDSCMKVKIISSCDALSLGDALRDLDAKNFIKSDFLLVQGDLVSNLPLLSLFGIHRENRKSDRGAVMTMVYRKASPYQKIRSCEEELVLVSESATNKVLHHQRSGNLKKISIPLEVFQSAKSVEVHYDLLDSHISLCSPDMLPLFSDNFDFQTQDDIIKGILVHQEIMGNSLYFHIVEENYAARVSSLSLYNNVTFDVIHRWVYPTVPEVSLSSNTKRYTYNRGNIYRHKNVTLGRNSHLIKDVVIDDGSEVGSSTNINNSCIGKNCKIGSKVKMDYVFMWENVVIGDGSTLAYCILANNVKLGNNCNLGRGCIIGAGVTIGDNVVLKENTQLSKFPGKNMEKFSSNVDGYLYQEEEDEKELNWSPCTPWDLEQSDEETSEEESNAEDDEFDEDFQDSNLVIANNEFGEERLLQSFYNEVFDSILRIMVEGIKADNIVLEINCSKHANNISSCDVVAQVVKSIFTVPVHQEPEMTYEQYFGQFMKLMKVYSGLFKYYVHNIDTGKFAVDAIMEFICKHDNFDKIFVKILHTLYDKDFLKEESILHWYEDCISQQALMGKEHKHLMNMCKPFIEWLKNAEEESSEEE